jgi:hypothetical protein
MDTKTNKTKKAKPNGESKTLPNLNRVTVLLDDAPLFDEYVYASQEKRFVDLVFALGRLPKPPQRTPEPAPKPDSVRELVYALGNVLTNPECPGGLHNAIGEYLCDLENRTQVNNSLQPKYLHRWMPDAIGVLKEQAKGYKPEPESRYGPYGSHNWSVADMEKLQPAN